MAYIVGRLLSSLSYSGQLASTFNSKLHRMAMTTIAAKANGWILHPKPNAQASLRLFCFPFAGGGAQSFRAWPEALPSAVEACPVQLPGRESRMKEPPFSDVSPMVDALAAAIRPSLDKPFALFGHSMGAIIAFELARRLRRDYKLLPECLIVSARVAPQLHIPRPPINNLPPTEFLEALKAMKGTPKEVLENAELMEVITPLLRADLAVHEEYTYLEDTPLECPILAFGGLQDTEASRQALDAWREQTKANFTLRMLPGEHFFIVTAQTLFLRTLSQELYQIARRATQLSLVASPSLVVTSPVQPALSK
jgi:medium-chain acyl-[acyl-carrier-protein] hydrolase